MRSRFLWISTAALLVAALGFFFFKEPGGSPPPAGVSRPVRVPVAARAEVKQLIPVARPPEKKVAASVAARIEADGEMAAFAAWSQSYLEAEPDQRAELVLEGIKLAAARRPVMRTLIKEDPRQALASAVPMVVRQQLPPEVLQQLERRVSQRMAVTVYQGTPPPGSAPLAPGESLTYRIAQSESDGAFNLYVYGQRAQIVINTPNAAILGIGIDREIAANDAPLRVLEVGEVPDQTKQQVTVCPISGIKSANEDQTAQPVTPAQADTVVETPEEVVHLCGGYHRDTYSQQLVQGEGATGGPTGISGPLPAAPTPSLGQLKVLYIPLTFQDQNAAPSTEAASYQVMRDVSNYYLQSSYGKLTTLTTVTPPVKLPKNEAWYVQKDTSNGGDVDGLGLEMTHAREEARRIGFDYNDYDVTVVRLNGGARPTGGWGGSGNVWVYSDSIVVCAHEIGHSFGLSHANYWDTSGTSAIGPGTNAEYGDQYDVMGSGGVPVDQYNTSAKFQIKWLPDNFVQKITGSGLYRLYAFDQPILDPRNRYALTIIKDSTRTYWGELRQQYTGSASRPWVDQGMILGWKFPASSSGSVQLIDTTPGSPYAKDDAPVALGQTFGDTESGIYITTVGVSSTTPKYLDVQVNMGDFSGNQDPTLTLAASAVSIPLSGTVTFTATAADPEGDTLAYQWQHWGDTTSRIVSPNAPVITRTFTTAGTYVVSCTVSDMKGGTVTREKLITVGSVTSKFNIAGRVTANGAGLPGVLLNANGTNPVITDQDGYYTITNLAANTYAVTPLLYGYSFTELFNNSITVGPSFAGADFTADGLPAVSLSAPDNSATENAGAGDTATFRFTRTGDTSLDLIVGVATATGTASTSDYTLAPVLTAGSPFTTFTIPAGSATLDVVLTTVNDAIAEGPETMTLVLASGAGYLVASSTAMATVTIIDDDTTLPQVGVVGAPAAIMENGTAGSFTFTRTGVTTSDLIVACTITGTATNGTDYAALSGTVTIPSGSASTTVTVTPVDDTQVEYMETIIVTIPAAAGYVLTSGQTTATINLIDDDTPTVNVAATDPSAAEVDLSQPGAIADTGTFVVTRTGDTSQPLTIYYSVAGNQGSGSPALNGVDYEALSGLVVIPAGSAMSSITIIPRWDNLGEGPEQVVLQLGAGPTNYLVGASASATVTIADASANTPDLEVENMSSAAEPATNGVFRLTSRGGTGAPLVVHYTLSGTAINGTDYDNPATWNAQTSGVSSALLGVWGNSATSVWTVGDGGTILKWNGTAWAAQTSGVAVSLRAVWGVDASTVWAVGDGGAILKWNGTAWSAQTSGTTNALRGVWGTDASNVWAVGDGGTILKWNGTAWAAQTSGVATALYGVWGSSTTSIWAVGAGGVVRFWNGTTWAAQTSNTTQTLRGVWGSSAASIWAAGTGGTILKSTGTTWSAQTSTTTQDLYSIWGADANNLWVAGNTGTALRATNGSNWAAQVSNAAGALNCVRGSDVNNVWAVGDAGSIVNTSVVSPNPFTGTLVIPAGATTYDLTVRPINDAILEDIETITLTITPDAAYQTFSVTAGATMWLRDGNQPTVWADAQINTSGSVVNRITENSAVTPRKYYISRTGSTVSALTVNFAMQGTATAGADYTIVTSGTLTFDNASSTGVLTIPVGSAGADVNFNLIDDAIFEGTETMIFHFNNGSYSKTADALIYIDDNETSAQTVQFGTSGVGSNGAAGPESTTSVSVPVTLASTAAAPVTVDYVVDTGSRSSTTVAASTTFVPPYWVRMVRNGSALSSYFSNDGVNWNQAGTTQTISFAANNYTVGLWAASNTTSATCVATIDNVSITGLDSGISAGALAQQTIGTSTPASSSSGPDVNGVYTLTAGGLDVSQSSTTDVCRYLSFPITGSAGCTITARVASITGGVNSSKAGVMIRETTANTSKHMSMCAEKIGSARAVYRVTTNGATATSTLMRPYWVRLTRAGSSFSGYYSMDGSTWLQVSTTQSLPLSTKLQAGLAVSARSDGLLETATFDNVSIDTVPTLSLVGRTIGFVNAQGSDALSGGVYTVIGSGAQIGGTEDECHFVAMPVTGDFTLTARVLSQSGGAVPAQAGVMIRESNTYRCRSVYMGMVENALGEFIYRSATVTTAYGDGIDYTLPSGSLTFGVGDRTKNIALSINNDSIPENDETITLILRDPNGATLGANATYTYTIIDDDTPPLVPSVGFAASTSTVAENAGTGFIQVSLSALSSASATVDYSVTGGTATGGGVDYLLTSGTLTFAPGELLKSIPLTLVDDQLIEGPETVVVALANAAGANPGSVSVHTLTIADDDFPVVSIVATDANAAEAGLDPGTFTVTRTGPTGASLTVSLTRSGTATSGSDYNAIASPLSLVIPAGAASATLTVTPIQDASLEGPETVIETINANASYTVGSPATATVTIADDDRSTVNLVATDASASETAGNPGQFTVTRTAPSTSTLTVNFTIAGTATNTTDYATLASSISFAVNETSKTITVTPVDDSITEGDETVVISINTSSSYDIGANSFDVVTIQDNDSPPVVYITSPGGNAPLVTSGHGLILGASATDDGQPQPLVLSWTQASGPGTATFATPAQSTTAVTFSADGVYVLKISATDGQFIVSDQVTVIVGSAVNAADWIAQDMSPTTQQRGQSAKIGGSYILTGMAAGYASTASDGAHLMARQVAGDGSIVARLTTLTGTAATPLAGVTIRDSFARSSNRAVLGYTAGTLQFRTRITPSSLDAVVTQSGVTLPVWVRLDRTGSNITASYAPDVGGAPGSYTVIGTPTSMTMADANTQMGLTATGNTSTAGLLCTATFDNVTLTPTPSGPAVVAEDFGTTTPTASTFSVSAGTYSVGGSGSIDGQGAFYGWQYYGDLMVTAKLATATSSALSAISGIELRESMDSTAGYIHIGRKPQTAFGGYQWRTLASGSTGSVPAFGSAPRWMRLVRQGNRVTGYHAPDASGSPGTWTQLGQSQTIIMPAAILVGFGVDNSGGTAGVLNLCTFSNLSIVPLNNAPVIGFASMAVWPLSPIAIHGTVTDDNFPAPVSLANLWSKVSGPGVVTFGDPTAADTTAVLGQAGAYVLRLTANDSSAQTFKDLSFTGYAKAFEVWQAQNWTATGGLSDPNAAQLLDPDFDGQANLLEYAFGTAPLAASSSPLVFDTATVSTEKYLRISVPKNTAAIDVTFTIEATSDLTNPASWSSAGLVTEQDTATRLIVRDSQPMSSSGPRFMRVKVVRN